VPGPALQVGHDSTNITTCVDGTAVVVKDTNKRLCLTFRHDFRRVKWITGANMLEMNDFSLSEEITKNNMAD
jgi:hypothetical protein